MKFQFGFDGVKNTVLEPLKIQHTDADTPFLLSKHLHTIFSKLPTYQPIVVICVGTDRSTGDSLRTISWLSFESNDQPSQPPSFRYFR